MGSRNPTSAAAAAAVALLLALAARPASASPLYDYVARDDGCFAWNNTGRTISSGPNSTGGWVGYILTLTSQCWLTPADFTGPTGHVWTHQLVVVVPDRQPWAFPDAGALWITGGGNGDGDPDASSEDILVCASLATTVGVACASLFQIPQQPVVFSADPLQKGRSEDALIAYTWEQFMINYQSVPERIAYFPMAKAGIKAIDATSAFLAQRFGGPPVNRWVTAGASKRGATTWLTGAVGDPRIVGIVPVVFDVLNFKEGVQHMYQTLGNWTFAFTDYRDNNVTSHLNDGTNFMDILAAQIDPLAYKENLTMSKLVVDATGDEFFQPQDDSFWWGQLPGESLRMMVDNAEHSMATGALYLITGAETWLKALLEGSPRPSFTWSLNAEDGSITAQVNGPLQPVLAVDRSTTTLDGYRRDFRLVAGDTPINPCPYIKVPLFGSACLRPIIWIGNSIGAVTPFDGASSTYVAHVDPPAAGWRAHLIEFYFNSTIPGLYFQLTTQVSTVAAFGTPLYPFPLCVGEQCRGDLV